MDGLKNTIRNSLQVRLALALSAVLVLFALVAGGLSFYKAFQEANELQDDILRQVAALIRQQGGAAAIEEAGGVLKDLDLDIDVMVQALEPNGRYGDNRRKRRKQKLDLPENLAPGLHTLTLDDDTYRILLSEQHDGQGFVVAQETDLRDDLAYESAERTVMPLLLLIPVLIGIVFWLVRRMFKPIKHLAQQIDGRDEHDLSPITQTHLPSEIQPFVGAINGLLVKVDQSMQQQRRFVADAAHELRTPMTALSLQAEHLANAPMSETAQQRVIDLRKGIDRSRHLLDQLLGLARAQEQERMAQQNTPEQPIPLISVRDAYREVLGNLMPLIDDKQMDIGLLEGEDVKVRIPKFELFTIIRNLVDNAIRYTPAEGQIDLSVTAQNQWAILEVSDSGPGIAATERERVLEPFYRALGTEQQGSGLGLSIVQTLVKKSGGTISLLAAPNRANGLLVRVKLPRG